MASKGSLSSESSSSIERSFGEMDLLANPEQAELDDLSTSSEEPTDSTSSPTPEESKLMFVGSKPLVLELHDITRDKTPATVTGVTKKKLRKKKKSKEPKKQASSSSQSDASLNRKTDTTKEEFYDAHESYHGIPPQPQAKQEHLKQIVSPMIKDTSLASVTVAPLAPGGLVIRSSADKVEILNKSAVEQAEALKITAMQPPVPQTASDPLASVKTAITKPSEP